MNDDNDTPRYQLNTGCVIAILLSAVMWAGLYRGARELLEMISYPTRS